MLVEDRADFRRGIASFLERQPDTEVVAQAGSLKEARRHLASVGCDVAVLDVGLPGGNGADLIGELREVCPDSAMLILSASLDTANLTRTWEAGADEGAGQVRDPRRGRRVIMRLGNG